MTFPSVLLIEDDEDDFRLTKALLEEAADGPISLDWESSYQSVTSGYTDDATLRGVIDSDLAFIQKPFTPAQLLARVRSALGRP